MRIYLTRVIVALLALALLAGGVAGQGLTLTNGLLENVSGSNNWNGTVRFQSGDGSVTVDADTLTISGIISDDNITNSPRALNKGGAGTLVLAGANTYRLTAPNQGEAFIAIRQGDNGQWSAALRQTADGPDVVATESEFATPGEAWEAAFELYRTRVIV